MKKVLLTTVALASLSAPALAAAPKLPSSWYVSVGAGLTDTRDSDWSESGNNGTIGIKNTANFSGAVGAHLTQNIRTEFEVSYRKADFKNISLNGGGSASLNGNLETWGFLANGYYDFNAIQKFSPYLSVGLGAAHHKGSISAVGSIGTPGANASDTVFAYQAGAGVSYPVTNKTSIFAGYRYFGSSEPNFDGLKAKYGANEFNAGVRFNF